jgi:energy-coupling factor transporter ATP-binding protein EcfA2
MEYKRITLLCGHYGSGKTNIAVNMALEMSKTINNVAIADLDIVNPYFRTKDSQEELQRAGVRLICSEYANSNLDIPALPQEIYSITDDKTITAVMDIGGDDRGALALGRFAPKILQENNYEMLFVINCYRPLTTTVDDTIIVKNEIERACGIPFTAIVNNSNLGRETTKDDVINSLKYAEELSNKTGLPIKMTTVENRLVGELSGKIENLYPLSLQRKII